MTVRTRRTSSARTGADPGTYPFRVNPADLLSVFGPWPAKELNFGRFGEAAANLMGAAGPFQLTQETDDVNDDTPGGGRRPAGG
ncbi:MAG: hypothetical protein JWO38_4466 [Gemmataceae bacterium]|nr:hypothetical protein [Gemmataceae bacterium]